MIRNSQIVFIETLSTRTALPWINNAPDFSGITEPTLSVLQSAWNAFLDSGKELAIIPDPEPTLAMVTPDCDWNGLFARMLGGDLLPLFTRATAEALKSNAISIARGDISLIITVIKNEEALASSLALLQKCGFEITDEEKQLWNSAIIELGFSEIVQI